MLLFPSRFPTEAPRQGYSAPCTMAEITHLACECLPPCLRDALFCVDSREAEKDYQIV